MRVGFYSILGLADLCGELLPSGVSDRSRGLSPFLFLARGDDIFQRTPSWLGQYDFGVRGLARISYTTDW